MIRAVETTNTSSFTLSDLKLEDATDPRIMDITLGSRLGMAAPRNIRAKISDNFEELQTHGEVCTETVQTSARGGRPGKCYFLNEPQALLICVFSNTPRAAAVRKMLIDVFMEYRRGKLDKPAHVREHDRRTSTKIEDALRLKKNIDRLEAITSRFQQLQAPSLCAMVIDGHPVWADLDDYNMRPGEAAVVMKWDGSLSISQVDNFEGSHSLASVRAGVLPAIRSPHGGKQRSVCLIIGKVVGYQGPEPTAVAQQAPLKQIEHKPVRTIYKEKVLELIARGVGNAEISRELGCCIETVSRLRRQIKDPDDAPKFTSPRFAPYRDRVIAMIKQGYGNAEISRALGCHLHTVERRRAMMNRQTSDFLS